jgi:3-methyladenine DNA glycosylase AlkC
MADLFKNIYNDKFFDTFLSSIKEITPDFNSKSFRSLIYDNEWSKRELKQRMRHISIILKKHLTDNYKENTETILKLIPVLKKNGFKADNLEFIFFPDFVELYGINNYEISIRAFEKITQFVSCEFAVRPFIIKYQDKMLNQMLIWSKHQNHMVRRLASEGCRPRLPWAMAIQTLKNNPLPIIPILENLNNDSSESVRRSVANNLNDISKDNPDVTLSLINKWIGQSIETDSLVKHAGRTLLKQGNKEIMRLFGFGSISKIKINNFTILTPIVKINDFLKFEFEITNTSDSTSKIRLEYGLYYQKANASLSKKVFMISEKNYQPNSNLRISRKQSFKKITTRKFHIGLHKVSLIINGIELELFDFELIE